MNIEKPGLLRAESLHIFFFLRKFFAVSLSKISDADKDALNTGLVGSIVSPMLEPVWAVDKLIECRSFTDVATKIKEMINF